MTETGNRRCRICLKTKDNTSSIYGYKEDEHLPTVIYNISGVKLSPRLEPEAKICQECETAVVSAQTIIQLCQESEQYLDYEKLQLKHSQTTKEAVDNGFITEPDKIDYVQKSSQEEDSDEEAVEDTAMLSIKEEQDEATKEEFDMDLTSNKFKASSASTTKKVRRSFNDPGKTSSFHCDHCDYNTRTGKKLIEHKRDEHQIDDPNIYACTLCPQRFSWKPTLYRHMQLEHNTVPDEKKFLCNDCGKAYLREVHLIEHTKQRHGPRRFKCADPECEQTFTRIFTLRRHFLAAHASTTRYHCAECNKYFKIYDLWKYHNEVVHKNEIVYCPRCGYPFRYKEKLEEHLEKDVCKRSVIPCTYCQRRFTSKGGLREHLKNIHRM